MVDKAKANPELYALADIEEQNAVLNRCFANLDVSVFKRAFERALALQEAKLFSEQGEPEKAATLTEQVMAEVDGVSEEQEVVHASKHATLLLKQATLYLCVDPLRGLVGILQRH